MTRPVRSLLAVAYHAPSGPKQTAYTKSECPVYACSNLASATLHNRTVLSKLALASFVPSGLNETHDTVSRCPPSECRSFHSVVSNRRRSPRADGCPPATASNLPLGENFKSLTAPRTLVSTFSGFAVDRSHTVTRP